MALLPPGTLELAKQAPLVNQNDSVASDGSGAKAAPQAAAEASAGKCADCGQETHTPGAEAAKPDAGKEWSKLFSFGMFK